MPETILNIYLIINRGMVEAFKAIAYEQNGTDEEKIRFLKSKAKEDFYAAYNFNAPTNFMGRSMNYKKFNKLEEQGRHFELFENIFQNFNVPEKPLICVTPVVDGEVWAGDDY